MYARLKIKSKLLIFYNKETQITGKKIGKLKLPIKNDRKIKTVI